MKINLNDGNKREELVKALAKLTASDPSGRFLDILAGGKLPKTEEEMTVEDHAKIAAAEHKRQRRAKKRSSNGN